MMPAVEPLAFGMADRLLTASVQGGVAALAVWVVCRTFRDLPAALRATLWWLVSAKLLIALMPLPVIAIPVLPADRIASSIPSRAPDVKANRGASRSAPTYSDADAGTAVPPTLGTSQRAAPSSTVARLESARAEAEPARRSSPASVRAEVGAPAYLDAGTGALTFQNIVIALIGVWGLVLLVHGAVLLRGLRHVQRILRRARVDVDLDADVARLSPLVGLRVPPAARLSDDIAVPQVVGLWRPVLLFPSATTLSSDERAMALAHELMHIRRRDLAWGWIPALAERLFFFHPLARLASQEYLLAREAACDAAVVRALTVAPDAYGRLLVRLGIAASEPALAASGASPSFSSLRRRLDMLPHALTTRATWRTAILVTAAVAVAMIPVQLVARADERVQQTRPEPTAVDSGAHPDATPAPVRVPQRDDAADTTIRFRPAAPATSVVTPSPAPQQPEPAVPVPAILRPVRHRPLTAAVPTAVQIARMATETRYRTSPEGVVRLDSFTDRAVTQPQASAPPVPSAVPAPDPPRPENAVPATEPPGRWTRATATTVYVMSADGTDLQAVAPVQPATSEPVSTRTTLTFPDGARLFVGSSPAQDPAVGSDVRQAEAQAEEYARLLQEANRRLTALDRELERLQPTALVRRGWNRSAQADGNDAAQPPRPIDVVERMRALDQLAVRQARLARLIEALARQQEVLTEQQQQLARQRNAIAAEIEEVGEAAGRAQEALDRAREALEQRAPESAGPR